MAMNISSLPSVTAPIPSPTDEENPTPETRSMSFSELWSELWAEEKGISFFDLIDIINPLQHIPVISTIYRSLTGDRIGLAPRLIGGALFAGPFGLANAVVTATIEHETGKTPASHVLAALQEMVSPAANAATAAAPQSAALSGETKPAAAEARAEIAAVETDAGPDPAPGAPAAAIVSAPSRFLDSRRPLNFIRPARFAPAPKTPGAPAAHSLPAAAAQQISSARDAVPGDGTRAGPDAERARIAKKIFAAQQAQSNLLLASIAANRPLRTDAARAEKREDKDNAVAPAAPFGQHPNAIPPGASPQWVSSAMGRALDKYQQIYRLRGTGVALPLPNR